MDAVKSHMPIDGHFPRRPSRESEAETGYNMRDFKIAVATAFGYSQTGMEKWVGIGDRAIRRRFVVNGEWIRQHAEIIEAFVQEEKTEIENVLKADLEEKLEKRLGKVMRNIDKGLDASGDDLKLAVDTAFRTLEQVRPKKSVIETSGRVLHAHAHTLAVTDDEAKFLRTLMSDSIARLSQARQLPPFDDSPPDA